MDLISATTTEKIVKRLRRPGFLPIANWHLNILVCCGILGGIVFQTSDLALAQGAKISDLIIDSSRDHLLLSVNLGDNVINGKVDAAPAADASATIIFSIALYEVNAFWFNKKIAHHTATNTVKRHAGQNEYRLLRSWHSGPPLKVDTLHQARRLMAKISDLKVMPLSGLEKGRTYQIRVRAVCQDRNALLFSSSACGKTDWQTVDFIF